jgi:U32 family peptidase
MHPVLPEREPVVVSRQIRTDKQPRLVVRTDDAETALAAVRGGAGEILFGGDSFHHLPVSVKEYEIVRDACRAHGIPVTFATARVIREKQAEAYVRRLRPILELSPDAVQIEFPGMLMWLKDMAPELPVEGGSSLNVFNREALSFAEQTGFSSQYLSQELTIPQIRDIARTAEIPVGVYVYGRTEMMISEYCAIEAVMTGKSKKECPGMCMKHSYGLTDREGRRFPLRTDEWCRMHVLNSRILDMRPYLPDLVRAGVSRLCLDVRAWQGDAEALTRSFVRILTGEDVPPSPDADNESTRGHFFRGVL